MTPGFERVLIDGWEGVYYDNWELSSDNLPGLQCPWWSIRKYTLRGGVTSWAKKQSFLIPYQQNFTYWSDPRNCGKLILGK